MVHLVYSSLCSLTHPHCTLHTDVSCYAAFTHLCALAIKSTAISTVKTCLRNPNYCNMYFFSFACLINHINSFAMLCPGACLDKC